MKQHGSGRLRIILLISAGILAPILLITASIRFLPRNADTTAVPSHSLPDNVECHASVSGSADAALLGLDASEVSGPIHILLIGQDRREGETHARADAIILCSFLPEQKQLVLTSFLRDLYVDIPGHQPDRINAAYAYGGMALLRQTMEETFDLTVSGCVEADFSRFSQVVDALGGVTIELRQDEADAVNKSVSGTLTEGSQLLNGAQALAYSRIRNLDRDGDFSRTGRQRKVLGALLTRFQDAGLLNLLSTALKVLPMLSTDLEQPELTDLALQLLPMMSDISVSSQRIPADGTFSYSTVRGMAVLEADLDAARQFLSESFSPDKIAPPHIDTNS